MIRTSGWTLETLGNGLVRSLDGSTSTEPSPKRVAVADDIDIGDELWFHCI